MTARTFAFANACTSSAVDAFGIVAAIASSSTLLTITSGTTPAARSVRSRAGDEDARMNRTRGRWTC